MGMFSMGRVRDKHVQYFWEAAGRAGRKDIQEGLNKASDEERKNLNEVLGQQWEGRTFGQVHAHIAEMLRRL